MKSTKENMENEKIRLLVISNNSLSNNNSNGRTLAGFLRYWDKKKIAQIYISGELPQSDVCENFFRITDRDVLKGFSHPNNVGNTVGNDVCESTDKAQARGGVKKSIFTIMGRDILWNTGIWYGKKLKKWIDSFNPQAILFFAGESTFTFNMTLIIAKKYNLPIIVFNTEGYYFKDKCYLAGSKASAMLYPLFHRAFVNSFNRLMKRAKYIIHANNKLKNDFDKCFDVPSLALYTSTNVEKTDFKPIGAQPRISYLGNLGVGRNISLCELADALQGINKDYKLDIYGKIPNDEVQNAFDNCGGINYKGVVSYDEVVRIMHESDLLVHTENFSKFTVRDLKYAFTTKIADSLACGRCFFVYAPKELACAEYLKDITCVASDKSELKEKLSELFANEELQRKYVSASLEAAEKNHRTDKNCEIFEEIVEKVMNDYESASN